MIMLDTHALLWAVADTKRLSRTAAAAIRAHKEEGLVIAAITLWELAMLVARGRIQAFGTVDSSVRLLTDGIIVRPITAEIASIAAQFPRDFPNDPADRLIAATARAEGLALITRDEKLHQSSLVETIW